ncbi:MAG: hypothetical protein HY402_05975 [Elusimicrobia bacterium]|nr:hypothetical protein [Elusimicrobiota bacterium]
MRLLSRLSVGIFGVLVFSAALVQRVGATELMSSARQIGEGSLRLVFYHSRVFDQELEWEVTGTDQIQGPNGTSFFSETNSALPLEGEGENSALKLIAQPWENLQYYAVVGAGNYSVDVPSVAVTNTLTGQRVGWTWGFGSKAVVVPETPVTPAVAVDASFLRSSYLMNRLRLGAGGSESVHQRLTLDQYQVSLQLSRRFGRLEPYGGVQWSRVRSTLKDLDDGERVGGGRDGVSPFLGLRLGLYSHEAFVLEASFVEATRISAGLEWRFK